MASRWTLRFAGGRPWRIKTKSLTLPSLPGKDPKGSGDNCPDHNNVTFTSVVSSPSRDVLQTANSAAPSEQSVAFPQPAATPSSSAGPPVISGLDSYRQNLLADGISEQTSELLRSHSWRTGTAGAYNSAWKQWSSWCRQSKNWSILLLCGLCSRPSYRAVKTGQKLLHHHPASRASFISFCFNFHYMEKEALHKSALSFEVAVAPILGLVIPVYRGQTGFSSASINFYEKPMVKTEPSASK